MSWVAPRSATERARLRLFCFPYAGAGASLFRGWSTGLPSDVDVCPVQLPGRESRLQDPPFHRIEPLITALAPALQPYLDLPFALFGHSMGALISFELARRLRRQYGLNPMWLFVSAHRAPQLPDPRPPTYDLPEEEFIAELRRMNGTPEAVLQHADLMQLLLPRLRADLGVCDTYAYTPDTPLSCPISAFGGAQDEEVSHSELEAWRSQTTSSFTLRMTAGNHFFAHTDRASLLSVITVDLATSRTPDRRG